MRRRAAARAWIAAAAVLAAAGYGLAEEAPRVRVAATGGTIARVRRLALCLLMLGLARDMPPADLEQLFR